MLDQLPTRPGGKIDQASLKLLADPETLGATADDASLALALMRDIWCDLLGDAPFERSSDFFSFGGHSLLAARLAAAIRREFGVALPVLRIFELRRLGPLTDAACRLAAQDTFLRDTLPQAGTECLPSPTQTQILRDLAAFSADSNAVGLFVTLSAPIAARLLEKAIVQAAGRHPLLRRRYSEEGRVIADDLPAALTKLSDGAASLERELRRPLGLANEGAFSVSFSSSANHVARFVVRAHPIAFDAMSLRILMRDVLQALGGSVTGSEAPDYARWARQEHDLAKSIEAESQLGPAGSGPVHVAGCGLSQDEFSVIDQSAAELGVTTAALLLARYHVQLRRRAALEPVIECAVSLRSMLPEDLRDEMIGPLTVGVPLVLDPALTDEAELAVDAALKIVGAFKQPWRDRAAPFGFSYREPELELLRGASGLGATIRSTAPLWNRLKLSVMRTATGGTLKLHHRADFDASSARALLHGLTGRAT